MARRKYEAEAELAIVIEGYFGSLGAKLPNKAGLCVFLGISRDTYSEYRKRYPGGGRSFRLAAG